MSASPFHPDDPRLTAYALGEADEADRRAVEEMLAESAEARAEIARTQEFTRILTAQYARENELYMASRPVFAARSNVIPFSHAGQSVWRRRIAPALAAAAVLGLTASLVYLNARRSHQPAAQTAASAPPGKQATTSPSPSSVTGTLANDQPAANLADESRVAGRPPNEADPPQDTSLAAAAPDQTRTNLDRLSPVESQQTTLPSGESAARPRAAEPAPADAPAPFVTRGRAAAKATTAAGGLAEPAGAAASDELAALHTVRIRTSDGRFFDGVVVSTNGLILSFTSMADKVVRRPCTVTLADQREFTTTPERAVLGAGWYWLRIKADRLSAASLGTDLPAKDMPLVIASVNPRLGKLTFSHLQVEESGTREQSLPNRAAQTRQFESNTELAFSPTGELLVVETSAQQPASLKQARVINQYSSTRRITARSFTPAEQKIIRETVSRAMTAH